MSAVKTVLASVVTALAFYQVFMMVIAYKKLRLPFLRPEVASFSHRSVGDSILLITVLVGYMCLGYFGVEDGIEHARDDETTRAAVHVVASFLLLGVLALKILILKRAPRLFRYVPLLGLSVFALLLVTWATSGGDYLWGG